MIAKLIPVDGSAPISITRDITIVGRKRGHCDMVVDHQGVSKLHCAIAKTDGLLFIRDLGSTNGTKVNGQRVMRGALLPGDELAFGSMKYRVHLGPGEPEVGPDEKTEMLSVFPIASREEPLEPQFVAAESVEQSDSDVRLVSDD
ncbi:MAG: FHA domain-containing protein [Planctomycetota bacterium]|nr:MAG: FHA domain-containing protein [Planctomycetota bacterium]REJ88083.1 MAG: FHA domain-containing protein [Planctomycetota bacterium]REK24535.1 MAG: FHA domain-containing protein [Planctomycetota bacterium]REK28854.1 MAG: FHA domain-containing protein [Planctomycetota bacterium]